MFLLSLLPVLTEGGGGHLHWFCFSSISSMSMEALSCLSRIAHLSKDEFENCSNAGIGDQCTNPGLTSLTKSLADSAGVTGTCLCVRVATP